VPPPTRSRLRFRYQITLIANCTSLALVVVDFNAPACHCQGGSTCTFVIENIRIVGIYGQRKVCAIRTLKISARNCTLKFSEILRMGLFLKNERSRFTSPLPE